MKDEVLISVIVPVFNTHEYLKKCLDSIASQSFKDFEVLLIDDGSNKECADFCDEISKSDERITVFHKENQGLGLTRNYGIERAKGKYLTFIDSDDWIDSDCFETAVNEIENSNCDLVFWSYVREFDGFSEKKIIFDNDVIFDEEGCRKLFKRQFGLSKDELHNPEAMDSLSSVCIKLFKTSIIKDNNLLFLNDKQIGPFEDRIFSLQYMFYCKSAKFIERYFYHYRKGSGVTAKSYREKLLSQYLDLFSYLEGFITDNNLDDDYKKALKNGVALSLISIGVNEIGNVMPYKNLKKVLKMPLFKNAVKNLEIGYLPLKWKIFYICIKLKAYLFVYAMLKLVRKKIRRF